GARGDLDLIVKQQSLIGFDLKLTLMGLALVPTRLFGSRETALPCPTLLTIYQKHNYEFLHS
ncbi:MAG: hypothetical protein WBL95_25645, partial [Microcoleus sp.]